MMSLLSLILVLCFCQEAWAVQVMPSAKITYVENGWYGEGVAIHMSIDGPPGCSAALNDLAIDKNHPSYQELIAMALTAYTKNMDVGLVVDPGVCLFGGRVKVIAIRFVQN
ncbi:hypothetical protein [Xanthomonas rydalmerensis]|uniref:Uncharacterized protein n=1 Tax=Xanthomonas rydalmerensis TaxID=3046274 RepID=A0ABZ0JI50_9XANT|nr:hypothetical protein [Xanthomonas sp. DM-2023]WOS39489.1 hypothetical protein QN243_13745 [Xanthomonas sp. DM-2023]WOS43673.1 hypothetical protein QN242_13745 [Xanthomonas sp. DM-2023]WOS47854.1 hypothetical protein QN240_13745 [Xanthomonas sp. DM-2023]WOS52032.1 hypothetical protein QN244_13745 [Xanthomonas sp. DM-2023]WOS56216.1 hypothetical protein QN245_13745 [Xanthomonas sp. DM-2023]